MMILNKRIKRELKGNIFRYGALFFLIVLSISIVVSMASATDSVFYTVNDNHEKNHIEDGEFNVFVPYSDKQIKEIESLGVKLEENFYTDIDTGKGTLRVFKNREFINTVAIDKGVLADDSDEVTLEKLYAQNYGLKIGDAIEIKDKKFTVTGIGSAPDYAYVKKNPYDVAANAKKFCIAFVSGKAFEELMEKDVNVEFCYSYRITGDITDKKLREYLLDMDFDKSMIKNKYMKEIVDRVEGKKQDLVDGIDKLAEQQ
jgi:putative ABC transport system permease protein